MQEQSANERLEPLILVMRGQRVILDAELARLYGVTTKRFNEAFKRNRQRFPGDFAFQLSALEYGVLRSPVAPQGTDARRFSELVAICDQFSPSPGRELSPLGVYRAWRADGRKCPA